MDEYVLYFIDYEKKVNSSSASANALLNNFFKPTITEVIEWNINDIYIPKFTKINTYLCNSCFNEEKECKCSTTKGTYKIQAVNEDYILFKKAALHYKQNFIDTFKGFILHKSSTTTSQSDISQFENIITTHQTSFDIFYLTKWLDKAESISVLETYNNGLKYIRTYCPNGLQSVLFNNSSISKILEVYTEKYNAGCRPFSQVLNMLVQDGCLIATSTTPLLFSFNSSLINPKKYDYLKTCEFQGSVFPEEPLNRRISSDISFFWIFIVLFIVGLTLYISKRLDL